MQHLIMQLCLNIFLKQLFEAKHKSKYGRVKILTTKQMIQRLQIALAQVKAGDTPENLLNEITKIIYSFYRAKKITKKVCNILINSGKL